MIITVTPNPSLDRTLEVARLERGENLTAFQRKLADFAEAFSGFFDVMRALRHKMVGPRFDQGFPERYPSFDQLESGEVVLRKPSSQPPQS